LKGDRASAEICGRRLDQWLWFARLVKSRSRGARLCAAGAIAVNGKTVTKANHVLRTGENVTVRQRAFCRTVRVLALGERRGPAAEARLLYEETAPPVHQSELMPAWTPLLMGDDERRNNPG
jgi:ribosome-associated heat shock protein Hsp15